jgi:hypothetical protein
MSHNTAVESYGITAQDINAKISTNTGDIRNTPTFECVGIIVSLENNFTPSARG